MHAHVRALLAAITVLTATFALPGCSSQDSAPADDSEDAVIIDNRTPLARAQYQANVAFAKAYKPNCQATHGRPRVLVTGFGRFMSIKDNATGRLVSRIAGFDYPMTDPPAEGQIDPPGPQTRTGSLSRAKLPKRGEVDFCGIILPVFWDLAAILIAKEIDAFKPDLVVMNGVAGERQHLWIELGSVNRAMRSADGSDILVPYAPDGKEPTILAGAPATKGLRLSWDVALRAAAQSIEERKNVASGDLKLADVLLGAKLAGFPRGGNTYLCNNVTYATNYLMDNPGKQVSLLRALDRKGPDDDYVRVAIAANMKQTPRVFMHWPSELVGHPELLTAASDVLRDVIDAQLVALASGAASDAPTIGTNDRAADDLKGGEFF